MNKIRKETTKSYIETEHLAQEFAKTINTGKVIALYGGLGMGKTAFCRGFVRGMDSSSDVSSPTYAMVHEYKGRLPIYHFDMYRISSWDDLYSTGFFDYIEADAVLLIEWSENIENALPEDTLRIKIEKGDSEDERIFTFEEV